MTGLAFCARTVEKEASCCGGVAEWLNAAVLKTVERASVPGVRIPPPPPPSQGIFRDNLCGQISARSFRDLSLLCLQTASFSVSLSNKSSHFSGEISFRFFRSLMQGFFP